MRPLVSIIIPSYNSARTIRSCLESIRNQTYENIEVIVVDRFSLDNTAKIAEDFGARVLFCGIERSVQVNFGARYANGDFLYIVASDFILQQNVVEKCVDACDSSETIVVVPNYSTGKNIVAKSISYKRKFLVNDPLSIAARFFRKEAFFRVGGYDAGLVFGEDLDLHNRLLKAGCRPKKVESCEWHIGEPETLREFTIKNLYYGAKLSTYITKNRKTAIRQGNPFRRSLFEGFSREPSLIILSTAVIEMIRYSALLAGLIVSNLIRRQ
jgi:glycosyltransferase involved in cell wall biosynthesis